MLNSYSKPIRISILVLALICVLAISWALVVFNTDVGRTENFMTGGNPISNFLGEGWIAVVCASIFLIFLLLISKFFLRNKILSPIYKGFLWGIAVCVIGISLFVILFDIFDDCAVECGYSILYLIPIGVFSFLFFSISLIIGTIISYIRSKKLSVLIFLILLILSIMCVGVFGLFYLGFLS